MTCSNCGHPLSDGYAFCAECGQKVQSTPVMEDPHIYPDEYQSISPSRNEETHETVLFTPEQFEESRETEQFTPEYWEDTPVPEQFTPEHREDTPEPEQFTPDYWEDTPVPEQYTPDYSEVIPEPENDTIDPGLEVSSPTQPLPSVIVASNPTIVTLDPVHAPEADQAAAREADQPSEPLPRTAGLIIKKTVKAIMSVIFAFIAFGFVCAFLPFTILRPENVPALVEDLDVTSILDETGRRELIEEWLSRPPFSDYNISIEEVEAYLEREDLSDVILGALETVTVDSIAPYLVFSIYPLIITGILCALIVFDIFMLHRKSIRFAFLTSGIPIALAGAVYAVAGLMLNRFPGLIGSNEVRIIAKYIGGITDLFFLHGMICFAVGIVSIAVFIILMAVRRTRLAKAPDSSAAEPPAPTEVWLVTGLIVNFTMLIACMVLSFLYYLYIPW